MPSPRSDSRKRSLPTQGAIETFSNEVLIRRDPTTLMGDILFFFQEWVTDEGVPIGQPMGKPGRIVKSITAIDPMQFPGAGADPITGADLGQISGAGIGVLIAEAFNTLFEEMKTPPTERPTPPEEGE